MKVTEISKHFSLKANNHNKKDWVPKLNPSSDSFSRKKDLLPRYEETLQDMPPSYEEATQKSSMGSRAKGASLQSKIKRTVKKIKDPLEKTYTKLRCFDADANRSTESKYHSLNRNGNSDSRRAPNPIGSLADSSQVKRIPRSYYVVSSTTFTN